MSLILVVEDDADLVETYTDLLEAKGHAVVSAASAAAAIVIASETPPAVIILDLGLPGGSGLRVLEFARSCSSLENVRIIVVTGHSEMANFGLVDTADVVLTKPVFHPQLAMLVERFLQQARQTSAKAGASAIISESPLDAEVSASEG